MQIRSAQPADLEAARQLLKASGWQRRDVDADRFPELVRRSQRVLVAVVDGQVVGFIRALSDEMSNGYISMLVVAAEHRRKGIGAALMRAAMGDDPHLTWVLRAGRGGVESFYGKPALCGRKWPWSGPVWNLTADCPLDRTHAAR